MKKLTRIAVIFIVVALLFAWPVPVCAQDQDHGWSPWTISTSTTIYGVHFNITTFTIDAAVIATVNGIVEIHAQTVIINGTLTATSQGYGAGLGPSPGTAGTAGNGAGGGGYGGAGGNGDTGNSGGTTLYGSSLAPIDLGSGGGSAGVASGGAGGGVIIIHCIGTLTLGAGAIIEADGGDGATGGGPPADLAGGGGSGGSIYITAGTFAGDATATIHADGGAGGAAAKADGGGGGGGRIAIHYTTITYAGTTSAAGGTGANNGVAGTNVTGTTLWRTYKDSGYSDDEDMFDEAAEHIVYVKGTGLPSDTYIIVFWDANGVKIQVDQQTGTEISSSRTFVDASDPAGTWYASVYVVATPTAHSDATNLKADYAFYATATAIPEFSTVMAAIGVAGLCFGIYFWMRKKFKKQNEKFKIGY